MTEMTDLFRKHPEIAESVMLSVRKANPRFPPSVSAMQQEIDKQCASQQHRIGWNKAAHEQLKEREQIEQHQHQHESAVHRAAVIERITTELRARGFRGTNREPFTVDREKMIAEFCKMHNLTREQFDQMPDHNADTWKRLAENHRL